MLQDQVVIMQQFHRDVKVMWKHGTSVRNEHSNEGFDVNTHLKSEDKSQEERRPAS
jgi:hypothetical protein